MRLPPGSVIQIRIISALKDIDHSVGIGEPYDVCTLRLYRVDTFCFGGQSRAIEIYR